MSLLEQQLSKRGRDFRLEIRNIRPAVKQPSIPPYVVSPEHDAILGLNKLTDLVGLKGGEHSKKVILKATTHEGSQFIQMGEVWEDREGHEAALRSPLAPFVPRIIHVDTSQKLYVVEDVGALDLRNAMRKGLISVGDACSTLESLLWANADWVKQDGQSVRINRSYSMNKNEWPTVKKQLEGNLYRLAHAMGVTKEEIISSPIRDQSRTYPPLQHAFQLFDELASEEKPRFRGDGIWDNDLSPKNVAWNPEKNIFKKFDFGMVGKPNDIAEGIAVAIKGGNSIGLTDVISVTGKYSAGKIYVDSFLYKNPPVMEQFQQFGDRMVPELARFFQYPDLAQQVQLYRAMNSMHTFAYTQTRNVQELFFQMVMTSKALAHYKRPENIHAEKRVA